MDIVATSLEALIQRATSPTNPGTDTAAVDAFCGMVNKEPNSAHVAARLITAKIQSPNEWEALQGLNVLEACMKRCGSAFHAEVGKFRFLNEMIKLVSPKYLGGQTPQPVRERVLQLMYTWTREHPREPKIKEAYQMLRKQGVVTDDPRIDVNAVAPGSSSLDAARSNRSSVFEDEKKERLLQKLLQSKNPEDLQAANRLIKTMVKEDERRTEIMSRRATELEAAHNNARLLSEMLDCYRPGVSSEEDLDLIKELQQSCERFSVQIVRDLKPDETLFGEVKETREELNKVFFKYQQVVIRGQPIQPKAKVLSTHTEDKSVTTATKSGDSLLDLSIPVHNEDSLPTSVNLMSNQLADLGLDVNPPPSTQSTLDALGDIFGSVAVNASPVPQVAVSASAVLQPMSLTANSIQVGNTGSSHTTEDKPGAVRALEDLDALGESLLKQSLPRTNRAGAQFNKSAAKVPMNQMNKLGRSMSSTSDSDNGTYFPASLTESAASVAGAGVGDHPQASASTFDLDFLIKDSSLSSTSTQKNNGCQSEPNDLLNGDDAMVDLLEESIGDTVTPSTPTPSNSATSPAPVPVQRTDSRSSVSESHSAATDSSSPKPVEVKPLSDISLSLESIQPGPVPPLTALDERNGISVVLHLAKNTPRPDVSVYVVSTISKNSLPLTNYVFQAVVPKTCKLRLLPASSSQLPAHSPFLPPSAITQIMLVANPSKVTINLKFMVSYTMDEETVTEMGDVESLPMIP